MKNSIVTVALAAISFTACNSGDNKADESNAVGTAVTQTEQQATSAETTGATPISEIVDNYLQLKNALADDNAGEAATAGDEIAAIMKSFDKSALTPEQMTVYEEVEDDAIEHAAHIGTNGDNIGHQREHFDILSKDVYDLVKTFGGGQILYQAYCPMYNNNKGATWLSETKEIKNPYFGEAMLSCGEVKEQIN